MQYSTTKYVFECFAVESPICASANSDLKLHKCDIPPQNTSFLEFTVKNQICATFNSEFKLHKCNVPPQNTSFWGFCHRKSDQCKCQLWLEIVQMRYYIAKYVFLCVLQWKTISVQVPTLTWNCTYAKILSQNTSFWVLYSGKPDLCNCQLWH